MNTLQTLCQLVDRRKAEKNPHFLAKYISCTKYSNKDASRLTKCIAAYLNILGCFATRLASTKTYRTNLQQFVYSPQPAGMNNVIGVVKGRTLLIEIKAEKGRLSEV